MDEGEGVPGEGKVGAGVGDVGTGIEVGDGVVATNKVGDGVVATNTVNSGIGVSVGAGVDGAGVTGKVGFRVGAGLVTTTDELPTVGDRVGIGVPII